MNVDETLTRVALTIPSRRKAIEAVRNACLREEVIAKADVYQAGAGGSMERETGRLLPSEFWRTPIDLPWDEGHDWAVARPFPDTQSLETNRHDPAAFRAFAGGLQFRRSDIDARWPVQGSVHVAPSASRATSPSPVKVGRPTTHDWVAAAGMAAGYLARHGFDGKKSALTAVLEQWFAEKPKAPDRREVERFVEHAYRMGERAS